jgi:GMP synthase (glutamine-hydrolysing)
MILLVSTCLERLSEDEFVRPIEEILKRVKVEFFTEHYKEVSSEKLEEASKVIVCGTALADFTYMKDLEKFSWVKEFQGHFLGICSGAQILAKLYECELTDNVKIGRYRVQLEKTDELINKREFYAYFLHSKEVIPNENFFTIASSEGEASIIKHKSKPFYGIAFHPEVLNPEIIVNFAHLK